MTINIGDKIPDDAIGPKKLALKLEEEGYGWLEK